MKSLSSCAPKNPFLKMPLQRLRDYLKILYKEMAECSADEPAHLMHELHRRQLIEAFHQKMKIEGDRIDPKNAEVASWCAEALDPYGVMNFKGIEQFHCVGRTGFARCKRRRIWVADADLPSSTYEQLFGSQSNGANAILDSTAGNDLNLVV